MALKFADKLVGLFNDNVQPSSAPWVDAEAKDGNTPSSTMLKDRLRQLKDRRHRLLRELGDLDHEIETTEQLLIDNDAVKVKTCPSYFYTNHPTSIPSLNTQTIIYTPCILFFVQENKATGTGASTPEPVLLDCQPPVRAIASLYPT